MNIIRFYINHSKIKIHPMMKTNKKNILLNSITSGELLDLSQSYDVGDIVVNYTSVPKSTIRTRLLLFVALTQ